jgi:hypothetical protein
MKVVMRVAMAIEEGEEDQLLMPPQNPKGNEPASKYCG